MAWGFIHFPLAVGFHALSIGTIGEAQYVNMVLVQLVVVALALLDLEGGVLVHNIIMNMKDTTTIGPYININTHKLVKSTKDTSHGQCFAPPRFLS